MTLDPGWLPGGIDTGKANIARVYDYWLGGSNNFRADQDAARALLAVEPMARAVARANRAFLGRAVRFLAGCGVRQFLDIGSGIPTGRNVHEVAQDAAPGSRVVYVDNDEVAVAHSRIMLDDNPDAAAVHADLRDPAAILGAPETQLLLDLTEPVGLLLVMVLHFIPDSGDPHQIVATLRDALPPGSHLVIAHHSSEARPGLAETVAEAYTRKVNAQAKLRTRAEILRFFDGFDLADPGLVWLPEWRPRSPRDVPDDPRKLWSYAGVGRLGAASR
jgi:SAM-dependent methyltransferase